MGYISPIVLGLGISRIIELAFQLEVLGMEQTLKRPGGLQSRAKFFVGGLLIVAAVVYLIFSSAQLNAQYFLTVNELAVKADGAFDRHIRVSGAVLGDTIQYDSQNLMLRFTVAHVPGVIGRSMNRAGFPRSFTMRSTTPIEPKFRLSIMDPCQTFYGMKRRPL
jgi:hypothetical protein